MITPISIDMASLNLTTLAPMLVAIFGALVILTLDLVTKYEDKHLYVVFTTIFLLIDLGSVVGYHGESDRGFFDVMLVDGISILAQVIIIVATGFFVFLSLVKTKFHEFRYPEYFALFLFMTAGFQFMASSDNLILILVGLETASMALYTMIAMHNNDKSIEAAIKYFTMGGLAAAFFSFGIMIFYYVTGSVELNQISSFLQEHGFEPYPIILVGLVFMIAALGFKLSLVPFHIWAPDVYEGSSASMAGYIAVVPKMAALVVAVRFFEIFIQANNAWIHTVLYIIAVISMTIPNMIALVQTDVKRMLAYSSISHAGFVLVAILVGTSQSIGSLFLYWAMFLFVIFGAFTMLWVHKTKQKPSYYGFKSDYDFAKFTGLVKTAPLSAFILAIFMFSLAGVPPFSVFWGKMYLISSTVNAGEITLAIIMVLNSAIAAFYYLKLVVYMFLKQRTDGKIIEYQDMQSTILKVVIGIAAFFVSTSIFWVSPLLELIDQAVKISGF